MTEKLSKPKIEPVKNSRVHTLSGGSEMEIRTINLETRCEINDRLFSAGDKPSFTLWVWLLQTATTLSDGQINEMTTEEIVEASTKVVEVVNKKK